MSDILDSGQVPRRRPSVVFGIGGTIEAAMMPYHLTHLRSFLDVEAHAAVTPGALEFVTTTSLVAVTGHPVYDRSTLFCPGTTVPFHNRQSEADLLVVYPGSARLVADCATGVVSCPVNRVFAFTPKERVVFVPFLHPRMDERIYVPHLRRLRELGCRVVAPDRGLAWIASPWEATERAVRSALGLRARASAPEVFTVEEANR